MVINELCILYIILYIINYKYSCGAETLGYDKFSVALY
jgi:hypothetical protein